MIIPKVAPKPLMVIMITVAPQNIFVSSVDAETGKGTDIFRVIMTVFGIVQR